MPLATVAVSVTTKTKIPLQDTEASDVSAFDLLADKHALVPRIATGPPRHFGCCVHYDILLLKVWHRYAYILASEKIKAWLIDHVRAMHGDDSAEYEQAASELLQNLGKHAMAWGTPPKLRPRSKPVVRSLLHNTGAHIVLSTENASMQLQLHIMSGLCTAVASQKVDGALYVQRAIVAGLPRVLGMYARGDATGQQGAEGTGSALEDMHFVHRVPDVIFYGPRYLQVDLRPLRLPCRYAPASSRGAPKSFVWIAGEQGVGRRMALMPVKPSVEAAAVVAYSEDELRERYRSLIPPETLDACIRALQTGHIDADAATIDDGLSYNDDFRCVAVRPAAPNAPGYVIARVAVYRSQSPPAVFEILQLGVRHHHTHPGALFVMRSHLPIMLENLHRNCVNVVVDQTRVRTVCELPATAIMAYYTETFSVPYVAHPSCSDDNVYSHGKFDIPGAVAIRVPDSVRGRAPYEDEVNITVCLPVHDSDVLVSRYAKWSMYTHVYKMPTSYKDPPAAGSDDEDAAGDE